MLGWFSIFIQILIENSASKQWRSWSDATFCGVWSWSALFAYVPQKGRQAYMGENISNRIYMFNVRGLQTTEGVLRINYTLIFYIKGKILDLFGILKFRDEQV